MSESISYGTTSVIEVEDQSNVSDNFDVETIDEWGGELTALVAENADVLVRCPWLNDAEVTLSAAMNAYKYPANMTAEDEPFLISVVLQLLANRVKETEVQVEEDDPEEPEQVEEVDQESNNKTEAQVVQASSDKDDTDRQSKEAPEDTKVPELPVSQLEEIAESQVGYVLAAEAEPVTESIQREAQEPIRAAAKTEPATGSSNSSVDVTSGNNPDAFKTINEENNQKPMPIADPIKDRSNDPKPVIKPEVEAKQPLSTFEIPELEVAAKLIVEARSEIAVDQETESPTLPAEAAIEPELKELSVFDFEAVTVLDDTVELIDEEVEVTEPHGALVTLEPEEEILIDHLEEADVRLNELHVSSIPIWEDATDKPEAEEALPVVQNNLTFEEIEDCLTQLAEHITDSDPETTEMVNEYLDNIIEVSTELEAGSGKNIITEAEAQEKLEMLFTELLENTGIDYTPEVIESLAYLTLKWRLADETKKLKNKEAIDKAPQDSGTHEIIKKLLIGLSTIKKAVVHAYAIGRSALLLYRFDFAI